jgi:hypothetical protein
MLRSLPALAVLAVSLAGPASALAQSAGDEQYSDPFDSPDTPAQQESGGSQEPGTAPETGSAPPAVGGNGTAAPAPTAEPAQTGTSALPRTGLPLVVLAAAGYALLLAGVAIRRQL